MGEEREEREFEREKKREREREREREEDNKELKMGSIHRCFLYLSSYKVSVYLFTVVP